ncbi:hypothetical protein CcaverHIS002_0302990 [Cutaneotrichosporon cavernicola]|uniref:Transmembrane protein n=1 Tax=Cutaneotrichosporon cavernicola TaxID=279322 RepID=A0AA48KZ90_9TREE|nr:uncharacterized protein CcaverHIS019_0302990 [Cutaneotrichosporon cavernicola]BEI82431.1 hypothetical protein CcaverHIS002_0302990 [Cutaneotrichosporon cavernicola]BEI90229.1 hypothetical protein CcaverHIS019_0302990 [Cutaneotrichosporon cavernicola]BEI98008.1 hypothetical protein CcaverHIS631_0303070 [Cutaneotrichosporon cavernicola]BEJ05784.1 hypothetical protein CcaverHIS641_0303060 [Cutaneotrichosporon cavernicola]
MAATQPQRPTRTLASADFPIDPSSPLFVAQAVVLSALGGAGAGGTLGWARKQNPFQLGVNMGINCGIVSLFFFGTREYLVSPILLGVCATPAHARRAEELETGITEPQSISDVRMNRILDSAIAGAAAGGGLSTFIRGPRTLIPAAFTAGLLATVGQGLVNQSRVWRLELLAKRAREGLPEPAPAFEPAVEVMESFETPAKPDGERRGDAPITSRMMGVLSHILPVKKLSDEDYLAGLEKKRNDVDRRIAEIDAEQLAMWTNAQK